MTEREVRPKIRIWSQVKGTINLGDYSNFTFEHGEERYVEQNQKAIVRAEADMDRMMVHFMEKRLGQWRERIEGVREDGI